MELKNIEKFLNLYNIGLFFAVVILLYITVIGGLIVSILNDKTYTEEKRIYTVKKIMQDIIDINKIFMYVLFGVFIVVLGFAGYNNEISDKKFTLSVLIVSIAVMVVMNSFCKYIQDIKETELYNHGLGMLWGGISAIVVIVAIFIWHIKNTSRTTNPTTSRTIATTSTPIIPTQRTFPTQRIPAIPTQRA